MLTEPQAFNVAVQALLSSQKQSIAAQSAAGGEHLVFFGSGREVEDQYVHMVVAFFLQRHLQFLGLVEGGFQAVHQALVDAQRENGVTSKLAGPTGLVDHNPALCLVCSSDKVKDLKTSTEGSAAVSSPTPAKSSAFFERMRSKSAVVKEKLFDYIVNPNIASTPDQSADSAVKSSKGSTKDFICYAYLIDSIGKRTLEKKMKHSTNFTSRFLLIISFLKLKNGYQASEIQLLIS